MLKWFLPTSRLQDKFMQRSGETLSRMRSLETATSLPLVGRMQATRRMGRLNCTFRTFFAKVTSRFFVASSVSFATAVQQHISGRRLPTGLRAKPTFAGRAKATAGPSLDCRPHRAGATAASLLLVSPWLERPQPVVSRHRIQTKKGGSQAALFLSRCPPISPDAAGYSPRRICRGRRLRCRTRHGRLRRDPPCRRAVPR
jgi:hypothetical protein